MEYRTLGGTGVKIAPLALGTANFADPTPEDEAGRIVDAAIEAGINLIDTADAYAAGESERFLGKALKRNGMRERVLVATKAHYPTGAGPNDQGNTRLHLIKACQASLSRLQVDTIDLYQLHRHDPNTPVEETLAALTDLVRWGMVRYIGCSTHPAWRVQQALMVSELKGYVRFVSEQPPYNLLDRRIENELVPLCQENGLGLMPWSPMAMGILAGRYSEQDGFPAQSRAALRGGIYADRVTPRGIAVGDAFVKLAAEVGISAAQLANLWVKDQPGITAPLIGPRTVEQLEHLLPVLEMTLDPEVAEACDVLVPPGSVVANFHNSAPWMKMRIVEA
ncbi:MAG: aldo/keto reductase [Trueperaceae bacterium]|nr:MAG: aldo/keto reductase [Trueperaceae bacterium]